MFGLFTPPSFIVVILFSFRFALKRTKQRSELHLTPSLIINHLLLNTFLPSNAPSRTTKKVEFVFHTATASASLPVPVILTHPALNTGSKPKFRTHYSSTLISSLDAHIAVAILCESLTYCLPIQGTLSA